MLPPHAAPNTRFLGKEESPSVQNVWLNVLGTTVTISQPDLPNSWREDMSKDSTNFSPSWTESTGMYNFLNSYIGSLISSFIPDSMLFLTINFDFSFDWGGGMVLEIFWENNSGLSLQFFYIQDIWVLTSFLRAF